MKNFIYLFVFTLFFSCENNKNKPMYDNNLQISLIMHPSDYPDDIRYFLNVFNDSLQIKDYSTLKEIKYKLKENEYNQLLSLKKGVLKKYHRPSNNVLGSWGCKLKIQNVLYYDDNDFNYKDPPIEIKNLIDYLVKLSPIDIELYSFS